MKLDWIRLINVRSFVDSGQITLGRVNVFVGANNAGKSTILRAVRLLQDSDIARPSDIRLESESQTRVLFQLSRSEGGLPIAGFEESLEVGVTALHQGRRVQYDVNRGGSSGSSNAPPFSKTEPNNLLYQYLSARKVGGYQQTVNASSTTTVADDLRYLVSRVSRLANPSAPAHSKYMKACEKILGFAVTEFASGDGQQAGRVVSNFENIPLEDMGEGVASIVGLLVDLMVAEGKIFLIEEPENDIHPKALKAMLGIIVESAATNQFLVTTHSHIVVQELGSLVGSSVFRVSQLSTEPIPTSTISELSDASERIEVLGDLGYELHDFSLFDGWIIFEESSAERICRAYLIPWFVPRLARARTLAAVGASKVAPAFNDLHRLFVFTHLEPIYQNRAFAVVDGDEAGKEAVSQLGSTFSSWDSSSFITLNEEDFERYYPARFNESVGDVLSIIDRQERRQAKKALLERVIDWIEQDREAAMHEFEGSASEVVEHLRSIDERLFGA